MSLILNSTLATAEITSKDSSANSTFIDTIGNKTDTAAATSDVVSIVGLLRYIIANMDSDADVAALIGALDTAAASGAVGTNKTIMAYIKQLITDERALSTVIGTAVGANISADIAAVKTVTDGNNTKLGTIVNTGGTAAIGDILGDFANVTLVSKLTTMYQYTPRFTTVQTVSAGSTAWTQAAHRLFTVTGIALVRVFGVVTTTLVGAGTLGVGVAGATNGLIATVADATTLATGDILANSGTATLIPLGQVNEYAAISDTDIDIIVGTANITAGRITFYCQYIPVSTGATVVANTWD